MTVGERKVRVNINSSERAMVLQVKQKTAELIDLINDYNTTLVGEFSTSEDLEFQNKEFFRLKALAMTSYEEACMWAVKALTV